MWPQFDEQGVIEVFVLLLRGFSYVVAGGRDFLSTSPHCEGPTGPEPQASLPTATRVVTSVVSIAHKWNRMGGFPSPVTAYEKSRRSDAVPDDLVPVTLIS